MGASLTFANQQELVPVSGDLSITYSSVSQLLAAWGLDPNMDDGMSKIFDVIELRDAAIRFINSDLPAYVDLGRPTVQEGNFISCGKPAGTLLLRSRYVVDMCEEALRNGATKAYFI